MKKILQIWPLLISITIKEKYFQEEYVIKQQTKSQGIFVYACVDKVCTKSIFV